MTKTQTNDGSSHRLRRKMPRAGIEQKVIDITKESFRVGTIKVCNAVMDRLRSIHIYAESKSKENDGKMSIEQAIDFGNALGPVVELYEGITKSGFIKAYKTIEEQLVKAGVQKGKQDDSH